MYAWLNGPGRVFRDPLPGSTNYLGAYDRSGFLVRRRDMPPPEDDDVNDDDATRERKKREREEREAEDANEEASLDEFEREQRRQRREAEDQEREQEDEEGRSKLPKERASDLRPYPLNKEFRSQSVLSDELREEIWKRVAKGGQGVAEVSALFGVEMKRVGAVVRMKTLEKDWEKQHASLSDQPQTSLPKPPYSVSLIEAKTLRKGKQLAIPYQKAILRMLPITPYNPKSSKLTPHESINDLPVHPATRQQIFYPTSESRVFTRADAAKAFSDTLLPADERIPHPELVQLERWKAQDLPREERIRRQGEKDRRAREEKETRERKRKEWEARHLRAVPGQRWDFRFEDISVEDAGSDGRGRKGVGWRYGMPHEDRKRGMVKIPTSVE
ncbi:hypothetical protein LTR50_002972 [Elasticomyces elasticus]|nr:hypothetical protein LTR50_002972 [Elasticomyces elasticus]